MTGIASGSREASGGSRFRKLLSLGRGGMADVDLALQSSTGGIERLAVIKRARPELAREPGIEAMFLEEARIAATLSHQNVIQTYEICKDEEGYFLVLEFLRGQSYAQIVRADGYADYALSLEVLLGTLQGLEYAHGIKHLSGREMSLVHRDISPPNVFVTYDGQVKVLDFGIAKAFGSSIHTDTGIIKGKVAYMAPEQMLGEPVDARADLYAVGVMLWEATAAHARFSSTSDVAVLTAVITKNAPTLPDAASRGLPTLADEICQRALAFDPRDRYASAREFHEHLLELANLIGPRPSARVVGQRISDLFSFQQVELQQRIEVALENLQDAQASTESSRPSLKTRALAKRDHAQREGAVPDGQSDSPTALGFQTDAALARSRNIPAKLIPAMAIALLSVIGYLAIRGARPQGTQPVAHAASAPIATPPISTPSTVPSGALVPAPVRSNQEERIAMAAGARSVSAQAPRRPSAARAAPESSKTRPPSPAKPSADANLVLRPVTGLDRGNPWSP